MKTVLITGGSGFVGRHLTALLQSKGYNVTWLTRKPVPEVHIKQYRWDYKVKKIDVEAIESADAIIHLAGANINGHRWNKTYKKEIYDSRVEATKFLFEMVSTCPNKIRTVTVASATGYYGYSETDRIFEETDPPGMDFLAKTCYDWEQAANRFSEINIRTSIIRCGIVFSKGSAAFEKISLPVRLGIGAAIGSGKQYFPWIHTDDLCSIYLKSIEEDSFHGVYNAVAPEFITNKQLTKILAGHFHKPLWLPNIPSFVIRIMFGEIGDSLLNGNRISFQKLMASGFKFKYSSLENML